jgi:alpha-ketoglutarate-dependent taurine dioxygenase
MSRRPIRPSDVQGINTGYLKPGQDIPFVVEPLVKGVNLALWAQNNRELIERMLLSHRAVLFRGFEVKTADDFKRSVLATSSGELLEYTDRSSPRHEVGDGIYVSTIYPADRRINLHNEGTYWLTWPLKIYFCCLCPPDQGGETPIADVRKVFGRLDPSIRSKFIDKQVMYVRNFNDGFGLSWQETFQTTVRDEVEAYCQSNAIEVEWKAGDRLRTRQVRPAVRKHPRTGELIWFNHGAFFHIAAREPVLRKELLELFDEQDLPYMTYYGDGTPIDHSVIELITKAYQEEGVAFSWRLGDVLLLDNMTVAHGREPYEGNRRIVVAMAEPFGENQ